MSDQTVKYTLSLNDLLSAKLESADQKANKFDTTMSKLQGTLSSVAAATGIAFGVAGVKSIIGGIVEAGTKVEDAQTGLTTLLKNAGEAKGVINQTMEDATKSNFSFEGLLAGNKAMIAAGANAKEARDVVMDLGNALAATGGGDNEMSRMVVNLQQIKTLGKASAMDIKQFGYAGINIYKLLSDATGKSVDQVKGMEVSYELLAFALKKAGMEGGAYFHGMENASGNTSVLLSNLGDALFKLKVRIFEDIKPAIKEFVASGQDFIKWLGDSWEWVKRNKDMLAALTKGVLVGVAAYKAYVIWQKAVVLWTKIEYASIVILGEGMLTANAGTKLLAGGLEMLRVAMLTNPIGLIAVAVGALAAAYMMMGNSADKATSSIENFNVSLMKTEGIVDRVQNKLSGGIMSGNNSEILGMNYQQLDDYRKTALKREEEIARKITDNEIGITTLSKRGFKNGQMANTLSQIKDLEDQNKILQYNLGNLKDLRGQAEKRLKKLPKTDINNVNAKLDLKSSSKITGNRSVNITININEMIHDFTVKTVNLGEALPEIKGKVMQALTSAINDSQIIANQ